MFNKGIVAYLSKLDKSAMAELMAQVEKVKTENTSSPEPAPANRVPVKETPPAKAVSPYSKYVGKVIVHCYSGRIVTNNFYEVLSVTKSQVKLQKIGKKSVGGNMWDMKVVPDSTVHGEIITKKLYDDGSISMGKYEGNTNIENVYNPDRDYCDNLMD